MTLDDFRQSLGGTQPPPGLPVALLALWWDGKGDWERAHESTQQDEGPEGIVGTFLPALQGRRSGQRCLLVSAGG